MQMSNQDNLSTNEYIYNKHWISPPDAKFDAQDPTNLIPQDRTKGIPTQMENYNLNVDKYKQVN